MYPWTFILLIIPMGIQALHMISDVMAQPGSCGPAWPEPCEAKLYEAPTGLPGDHGSGFTFLKPKPWPELQLGWLDVFEIGHGISVHYQKQIYTYLFILTLSMQRNMAECPTCQRNTTIKLTDKNQSLPPILSSHCETSHLMLCATKRRKLLIPQPLCWLILTSLWPMLCMG